MRELCEHAFEAPDPKNPEYSLSYNLRENLGATIRKHLSTAFYEIAPLDGVAPGRYLSPRLHHIVREANRMEGKENTILHCGALCPKRRR